MKADQDRRWNSDEFESLREILLAEEREAITYLAEQVAELRERPVDPERLKAQLRELLPEVLAAQVHHPTPAQLARWGPLVVAALQQQGRTSPQRVVEALRPIMGRLLWAYVVAGIRDIFKREPSQSPAKPSPTPPIFSSKAPQTHAERPSPSSASNAQTISGQKPSERIKGVRSPGTRRTAPVRPRRGANRPAWRGVLPYFLLVVFLGALLSASVWWFLGRQAPSVEEQPFPGTASEGTSGVVSQETPQRLPEPPEPEGRLSRSKTPVEAAQDEIDALLRESPIVFEANQTEPPDISRVLLDRIAAVLKKYPTTQLEIHVYTDNVGPESINKRLSQQRAEAIKRYLSTMGRITPARLVPLGHGSENPIASNDTPSGRKANRRAEFRVVPWRRDVF